jgi:type II secretory pathway pseudopilin PulG
MGTIATAHATSPRHHRMRGFSLLDVAIVIGIVGILVAGFLASYKLYQSIRAAQVTEENFQIVQRALGAYKATRAKYPAPAGYRLSDDDDQYGLSSTSITNNCASAPSAGHICRSNGAAGEKVLVGLVPFVDLNIPPAAARDGYGRLFTYAVSEKQTQANGNNPALRYVCVQSQDVRDNGSIDAAVNCTLANENPPSEVAIVSHGRDGVGAWLPSGVQYKACAKEPGEISLPNPSQLENCDFDATFIRPARRIDSGGVVLRQPSVFRGAGAYKNDDAIQLEIREDTNYWSQIDTNSNQKITNVNAYKVGIGTTAPDAQLHVEGNMKADSVLTREVCADGSSGPCLKVEAIAGDIEDMECSSGGNPTGMVKAIVNNKVECRYIVEPKECPSHQYTNGFDVNGLPVCVDMPASCGPEHNTTGTTAPVAANRCYNGTASAVSGTGPWTWTCTLGGQSVNCKKKK